VTTLKPLGPAELMRFARPLSILPWSLWSPASVCRLDDCATLGKADGVMCCSQLHSHILRFRHS
jgi:hypothetical protein